MTGNILNRSKLLFIYLLCFIPALVGHAQEVEPEAVRLTGIVLDADTREPVPYVSIRISGTQYGTSSDNTGYFSLFINPGDTLLFSSIGYQDGAFVMPFVIEGSSYSLVQLLRKETVLLQEVVVFPWPSLESFEQAFIDAEPMPEMKDVVKEVNRDIRQMIDDNQKSEYYYDQMRYQRLYEIHG
ncbi:MAG: carboxypeptidase-like regulatory domain-containing protein, partial [Fulvivirga sp.]|nr:carboxypeptidase-like regulatory domain-containing protein [Fulvivirga sp.]